ncbi:hypothetical protein K470DRAFT_263222 [Piedraia hortae CBS 480.64]|uniref:Uncharacterized protein n=1 Tax=Piedraia hortae CBS 480.64 TaxID=1314780 RepID=A0A6A7C3E4_9PEZI|nr:hypothetical protein K470DRAFT_263222 [Piedraia hortae CBS 480.64]
MAPVHSMCPGPPPCNVSKLVTSTREQNQQIEELSSFPEISNVNVSLINFNPPETDWRTCFRPNPYVRLYETQALPVQDGSNQSCLDGVAQLQVNSLSRRRHQPVSQLPGAAQSLFISQFEVENRPKPRIPRTMISSFAVATLIPGVDVPYVPWVPIPRWIGQLVAWFQRMYIARGDPYREQYLWKLHAMSRDDEDLRRVLQVAATKRQDVFTNSTFTNLLIYAGEQIRLEGKEAELLGKEWMDDMEKMDETVA